MDAKTRPAISAHRAAIGRTEFDLMRAQTGAYYASRFLAEHRGNPEARQGLQDAQRRHQQALEALRQAEAETGQKHPI